jgi:hypothetical protein
MDREKSDWERTIVACTVASTVARHDEASFRALLDQTKLSSFACGMHLMDFVTRTLRWLSAS